MDNILKYKNFVAAVKYSEEDEAFIGRIEDIGSVVSFEGQSVAELKSAFREAVESYLDFCRHKGISEPQKSYTGILAKSFFEAPLMRAKNVREEIPGR
jgi:predicted HicB family RNase H-like nuclease